MLNQNHTNGQSSHAVPDSSFQIAAEPITRRGCLMAATALASGYFAARVGADEKTSSSASTTNDAIRNTYPAQPPEQVSAVVGASHFNFEKVRALVSKRPALARAAWDWGFGDWESALGAASHMGRGDIAEFLIEHGARPTMYTLAMLGKLEAVRAMVEAIPGIQTTPGPHGIPLLDHARAGIRNDKNSDEHRDAARAVEKYLEALGDTGFNGSTVRLDEKQMAAYVGMYSRGAGASNQFHVAINRRGMLTVKQGPDGVARNLMPLGDHAFSPYGVTEVRIVFEMKGNQANRITIHDPDLVVTAKRS